MLKQVYAVYFSPTGGTKRAAICLAKGIGETVVEVDLSMPNDFTQVFDENDVIIFAAPVFAGRIPVHSLEKIKSCQANSAKVIAAVVYGNRHYDDALLEWNDCLQSAGFHILAATALIAEHSMIREVAAGRPDVQDQSEIQWFAKRIIDKLESDNALNDIKVSGNRPYVERVQVPVVPMVSSDCTACGICAVKCPVNAIAADKPGETEMGKCILCMRCVDICPQNARMLPPPVMQMIGQKLAQAKSVRRGNEFYL